MSRYEEFGATHRIVATGADAVATCKRLLILKLRKNATELRVFTHPTEEKDVPSAITALDEVETGQSPGTDDCIERKGTFPEAESVVDAVLSEMDRNGGFPITLLRLDGANFGAVVPSSTSYTHVGKLDSSDPTLLDELSDVLSGVGVVVPAGPSVGWEQDGTYYELDGPKLCVYEERPTDSEDQLATDHACYDLTRLSAAYADRTNGRIELEWHDVDSLLGRAMQFVFGRPPTNLIIPETKFETVETYLDLFLVESKISPPE